uniref:Reverse transcriptase domain-containing protein n=1 Tax=Amphimedon queenslandica TaxID=400682 RepID=A0A1X7UPP1_AMPQE
MALADFLRRDMAEGFQVGFNRSSSLRAVGRNLSSVKANSSATREYLKKQLRQATIRLALSGEEVHNSLMGLIPKSGQPGKYRLIVDLSSPPGASVNDGIDPELCSLSYSSVDEAICRVRACGPGAWMAKLDLKSAYRRVPVHPDDQQLLGMSWEGLTFCDRALPFGLRSAPKLFTAVANGLSWALKCKG